MTGTTHAPGMSAILAAAAALFAEHGYAGVAMSEVARRARVSKANLYHHFGSKQGLYLAVLRAACDQTAGSIEGIGAGPDEAPLEALRSYARTHLESMLTHPGPTRLVLREIVEGDERRLQALAEQVLADHFSRLVALVRAGQQGGALRADLDPGLLAFVLVAANAFFFESRGVIRHLAEAGFAADPGGYSEQVLDLVLRGALER